MTEKLIIYLRKRLDKRKEIEYHTKYIKLLFNKEEGIDHDHKDIEQ